MGEYSVAKAAELSLSRLFADRYADTGVLVNAVCPGPVKSEMWMAPGGLLDQSVECTGTRDRDEGLEAAGSSRPIGRLAEVDEIASAIAFLCSERASYVAGVGLERRRRHRPGDHLSVPRPRRRRSRADVPRPGGGRGACTRTAARAPRSSSRSSAGPSGRG